MKLTIGLTAMLCLFSAVLAAQPKPLPDSIRLEFPEHQSLITFELREYARNKDVIREFPHQLNDLLNHIKSSLTASDRSKLHHITVDYSEDKDGGKHTISIQPVSNLETKVTVAQQAILELLPPGWEITVKMKDAHVHIYAPTFERLEELAGLNLEPVIAQMDNDPETQHQKRFGLIYRIIMKEGKVQNGKTTHHRVASDMLGLHAGAGAGLLRDKFYPEFNFALSIYLANRYQENFQRFSAHYELKMFTGRSPEGAYRSWPATFISASYALNFRKDRPRWTGLGAGFLVHNRSDLFTGRTMKLFLESDIGSSKLNIIPELFLTDDYSKTLYGIKLNYKF